MHTSIYWLLFVVIPFVLKFIFSGIPAPSDELGLLQDTIEVDCHSITLGVAVPQSDTSGLNTPGPCHLDVAVAATWVPLKLDTFRFVEVELPCY